MAKIEEVVIDGQEFLKANNLMIDTASIQKMEFKLVYTNPKGVVSEKIIAPKDRNNKSDLELYAKTWWDLKSMMVSAPPGAHINPFVIINSPKYKRGLLFKDEDSFQTELDFGSNKVAGVVMGYLSSSGF